MRAERSGTPRPERSSPCSNPLGGKVTGMRITRTRLPARPRSCQKVSPCWLLIAIGRDAGTRRPAAIPTPTPAAIPSTTATAPATAVRRRKSLSSSRSSSATATPAIRPSIQPLFLPKRTVSYPSSAAAKEGL